MPQQIIIKELRRPSKVNLGEDMLWLSDSFGFSAGRDVENSAEQILRAVLQQAVATGSSSTEEISDELDFSIQKVNYHLRTLIDGGILYREKRRIYVRQGSVKAAVEEIRKDANRIFDQISEIAEEIDASLGFKNREKP